MSPFDAELSLCSRHILSGRGCNGSGNRVQQRLLINRLAKACTCAARERALTVLVAVMPGDDHSKLGYGYYSKYRNYYRKEYNKHDYYEN